MANRQSVWGAGKPVLLLLGLICLLQVVVLSLLRTGTSYDGAEQLLYTQSLQWGYGRSQPPLYTWLLIAVQQVFGVTQFSENLLKFSLLFALIVLMWRKALHLGFKATTAVTVAASPFLVFEIAWEAQRNYSHTVLLLALTAAFALCYLATLARRQTRNYVALGLILGLMLLTKYNALLFVLALVIADLIAMRREGVFWTGKAIMVPVVAVLVLAPHGLWAFRNLGHVLALSDKFAIAAGGGRLAALASGLLSYILACAAIVALPALIALLRRGRVAIAWPRKGPKGVFVLWSALSVVLGLVLVLAAGASHVSVRWMLPLAVPALVVICGFTCDADPRANRHFRIVAVAMAALAAPVLWFVTWNSPRVSYGYDELAQQVVGKTGATELVINDYAVLANLRLYAPQVRVLHAIMPAAGSVPLKNPVMVWTGSDDSPQGMLRFARSLGACPAEPVPHAYVLRSRRGSQELAVRYQAMKTDCG